MLTWLGEVYNIPPCANDKKRLERLVRLGKYELLSIYRGFVVSKNTIFDIRIRNSFAASAVRKDEKDNRAF